jgi:hypothetical protein
MLRFRSHDDDSWNQKGTRSGVPGVLWVTASPGSGLIELRADRIDAVTTGAARQTLSCKITLLQPLIVVNIASNY